MYVDAENQFSNAQAITVTAASTNIIDLTSDNNVGIGEPMAVVITVDVAADFTTGDETYSFGVEGDATAAFPSANVIVSRAILAVNLTAGSQHVILIPADTSAEQFMRLNYTVAGTTPTITVTADLKPASMVQNNVDYPNGYTIS